MKTDTEAEGEIVLLDSSTAVAFVLEDHEFHGTVVTAIGARLLSRDFPE